MTEAKPVDCLLRAIQSLWSGCIEVSRGEESIGQIVLSEGRIAWAICRGQSETLGIFLWRLGRISQEQLAQVQVIYRQNQGKKKLGAILEESGFMSRPVLRRCLLLHTRSAIEGILSFPDAQAKMIDGPQKIDEQILFGPDEVLPPELSNDLLAEWMSPDNTFVRGWRKRSVHNAVLNNLIALPDHLASAVLTFDGGVVTAYTGEAAVDLNILAVFVAAMLESSSRAVGVTQLETIESIMLESTGGWMAARWLDHERIYLLFVVLGREGNPALARHIMRLVAPRVQLWITQKDSGNVDPALLAPAGPLPELPSLAPEKAGELFSRVTCDESLESQSEVLREWRTRAEGLSQGEDELSPGDLTEALNRLTR
jgi:predicted regulator of Ras-like GTPase activity (Roadblock/LC7/MglB family)